MAANSTPGRDIRGGARQARPPKLHCIDTPVAGLVFVFWISRPALRVAVEAPWSPDGGRSPRKASIGERDGVDMPAVIGLALLCGAAVAEEALGLGIVAQAEVLEIHDAGALHAIGDVAGEIEHGVAGALRGHEEARVVRVGRQEARDEFRPDLVIRLPYGGAERRHDAGALGAERLHSGDCRLDHAGEGAAPAGMRRA